MNENSDFCHSEEQSDEESVTANLMLIENLLVGDSSLPSVVQNDIYGVFVQALMNKLRFYRAILLRAKSPCFCKSFLTFKFLYFQLQTLVTLGTALLRAMIKIIKVTMLNLTFIYTNLSPYIDALLNFIYPPYCLICNCRLESGKKITCETCWQNLPRIEQNVSNNENTIHDSFADISVWEYTDEVQKIIHEMKYFRKTFFGSAIGDEMADLVLASNEYSAADLIIPVPLHKTRLRERGFNQSLLLSDRIAKRLNIPIESRILYRVRNTKSQSKLSAKERIKNVQGAFKIQNPKKVKNKEVILVDDVLTTGSTLNACALSLMEAGTSNVLAVTAAKVN